MNIQRYLDREFLPLTTEPVRLKKYVMKGTLIVKSEKVVNKFFTTFLI